MSDNIIFWSVLLWVSYLILWVSYLILRFNYIILWLSYIIVTNTYQLLLVSSIYPYIVDVFKKITRGCHKILKLLQFLIGIFSNFAIKLITRLIKFLPVRLSTYFYNFFTLRIKPRLNKLKSKSLYTHLSHFFYFYFRRFARLSYKWCNKWARRFYTWYDSLKQEDVDCVYNMNVFVNWL
jgi:hypothetical protein